MNKNIQNRFPGLAHLFGAYFHQDWADEFASVDAVIAAYVRGTDSDQRSATCGELREFLSMVELGEAPKAALVDLGSYYVPEGTGQTTAAWLAELRDKLCRGHESGH